MKFEKDSSQGQSMGMNKSEKIIDVLTHNRNAWDKNVADGNCWTMPVSSDEVNLARQGDFKLVLTPTKPVPREWFPKLQGTPTLCLASGGGQQGPLLAAAGAEVTVFDNSPEQLKQDAVVAERDGLDIKTVEGNMVDLSTFDDGSFDLIVHPCSNCFVPEILPVWRECYRVLRQGGQLLSGICNPVRWIFEDSQLNNGVLTVRYPLPHSDVEDLTDEDRQARIIDKLDVLEFSHSLDTQIGGQLEAGFVLTGFYEDRYVGEEDDPLSDYLPTFMATRALKQ